MQFIFFPSDCTAQKIAGVSKLCNAELPKRHAVALSNNPKTWGLEGHPKPFFMCSCEITKNASLH